MKSLALHKPLLSPPTLLLMLPLLMLMLLLLGCASVRSHPMPDSGATAAPQMRPMLLIQNNVQPEDAQNYEISIPKDPKPGEPCLTISWKTNPDGSGPADPKIYWLNGFINIVADSAKAKPQINYKPATNQ